MITPFDLSPIDSLKLLTMDILVRACTLCRLTYGCQYRSSIALVLPIADTIIVEGVVIGIDPKYDIIRFIYILYANPRSHVLFFTLYKRIGYTYLDSWIKEISLK